MEDKKTRTYDLPSLSTAEPSEPSGVVDISNTQFHVRFDQNALAALVQRAMDFLDVPSYTLSIVLVDNATIHGLNRQHLQHDWPTDVITFPLSESDEPELAGELVVSAEMAAETARASGLDPWAELSLYVVHGLLHLCGYDDLNAEDADVMRRRESEILAHVGLTNTFPLAGPTTTGCAERESAL